MKKRISAIVLSIAMVATLTPVTAFAGTEALPSPGSPTESRMLMPVYTGNEPEVQAARYKAIGGLILSYARNPSLRSQLLDTFKTVYPDGINQETDLSKIPAEAKMEAGRTVGDLILGFARNPSLFDFNEKSANSGIELIMPYGLVTPYDETTNSYHLVKHDMTSEAAQVGCASAIGCLTEAYARNPSIKTQIETLFNEAFGGPLKYADGKVPAEVRAALVESAGQMLMAIARTDNNAENIREAVKKDIKDLFNTYSPVNFDELLNADAVSSEDINAPSVERGKMRAVGYYLIAYARSTKSRDELTGYLESIIGYSGQMDISKMSVEGKNGAAEIIGCLNIAYARIPGLKDDLFTVLNKYVDIEGLKAVDPATIAEGRMHAITGLSISFARNPALRSNLVGNYMNYLGTEPGLKMPYSGEVKGAAGDAVYGLLVAYSRNPSLSFGLYRDYLSCAGFIPAQGEGIVYTEKEGKQYIVPEEGYEISNTLDFKKTFTELDVEKLTNEQDMFLYIRKSVPDDPAFAKGIGVIRSIENTSPVNIKDVDVTHNSIRFNSENKGFNAYTCDGGITWQSNPEFNNLVPGTKYKIGMCERNYPEYIPHALPENIVEVTTLSVPVFDVAGCEFKAGESVNIAINCKDHDIYYTLDGTDPTKDSKKYEGPFKLDKTATVKAIAVKGDYTSTVITEEYKETADVTFKVKNGKWSDGTADDRVVKVVLYDNKAVVDSELIPAASDMEGYTSAWDKDVNAEIDGDTTFVCTFTENEKPAEKPIEKPVEKVVQKELTEVPESLKSTEFKTVRDIEKALEEKASKSLKTLNADKNYKKYMFDVTLMITENGVTRPATKEEIEARGGIKVLIPYPEGTNSKDYVFAVAHMLTVSMNGMEAGDIETPEVTLREDGIEVTLSGLSPVMVAYAEKTADEAPTTGDTEFPFMYAGILVLATGALIAVRRKKDKE